MDRLAAWLNAATWRPMALFVATVFVAAFANVRIAEWVGHGVFAVGMGGLIAGLLHE